MEVTVYPSTAPAAVADTQSAVSWAAVAAGAVAAAALALLLVAFGAGLGLSAISPWSETGVSTASFKIGTGIYLVIVAVMSSAVGGYLAGRLRTKWIGLHGNEAFFRDTAHGFLAWAFATLISATALAGTTAYLANGTVIGAGGAVSAAAQASNPADLYVDKLFRSPATEPTAVKADDNASTATKADSMSVNPIRSSQMRSEVLRLWTADFRDHQGLVADDKRYVTQLVAARTGLSDEDADKRVNEVVAEAKTAADNARKGAATLSFWFTAAMLFGAFAAALAGAEGGSLRDGTWNDRILTPRAI